MKEAKKQAKKKPKKEKKMHPKTVRALNKTKEAMKENGLAELYGLNF